MSIVHCIVLAFGVLLLVPALRYALHTVDAPVTAEEDEAIERHLCVQDRFRRLRNHQLGNEQD